MTALTSERVADLQEFEIPGVRVGGAEHPNPALAEQGGQMRIRDKILTDRKLSGDLLG